MLSIGHLNIYHLEPKLPDICNFLNNSSPNFHLYGITESRLHSGISNNLIRIANYDVVRRDAQSPGETGIVAYVHQSVRDFTRRRKKLEHPDVECMWLEIKQKQNSPSVYVCFLYRNPASTVDWYDSFIEMLDNVYRLKPHAHVIVLGDFNIDLKKPQPRWETISLSLGLKQFITEPTRVTPTSQTLLDHVYSNTPSLVKSASLSNLSISDHSPICCTVQTRMPKERKHAHTPITFRSFKRFNLDYFLHDISLAPFQEVLNHSDPDEALSIWYNIFLSVLNKHAPTRQKRVKHPKKHRKISLNTKQLVIKLRTWCVTLNGLISINSSKIAKTPLSCGELSTH